MEEKSNQPVDQMKNIERVLDEYESALGFPHYTEHAHEESAASKYIGMSRAEMESLDVEAAAEIAIVLSGLAFHIQRSHNREVSRINWAKSLLKEIMSGREVQYKGSWDSQYMQAVNNDTYAKMVYKIQAYAQQRADRLQFLSNSIKHLSDQFSNLQRAKAMK